MRYIKWHAICVILFFLFESSSSLCCLFLFLPANKFALFCLARFVSGFFSIGVNSENFLLVRTILNCMQTLLWIGNRGVLVNSNSNKKK